MSTAIAWPVIGGDVDQIKLARLLRRAHTVALSTGTAPPIVRSVISDSWRRSADAGVDPSQPAPKILDAAHTAALLAQHPIANVLPRVAEMLKDVMADSGYLTAFSDANGILLWTDGSTRALRSAVTPRFLPGSNCSEDQAGTNAIGTALVLKRPVQIFSAEHFSQVMHGWICAAAPVCDPHTGELLGAIDVSGDFRTGHVHSLALVTAVAQATEGWLAGERNRADERLRVLYQERWKVRPSSFSAVAASSGRVLLANPPGWVGDRVEVTDGADQWPQSDGTVLKVEPLEDGFVIWREGHGRPRVRRSRMTVQALGRDQASIVLEGKRVDLRLRHSEIVALLAVHREGMTVRQLADALYGDPERGVTVRAEIARLRPLLGSILSSGPYRLEGQIQADVVQVGALLEKGQTDEARAQYAGSLLPASVAPGIVAVRDSLERELNKASDSI